MTDDTYDLKVGDIVRVKQSPTISANVVNGLGFPLDGRIGEIERITESIFGYMIYEVRIWWHGAHFNLIRSQLEHLPGVRSDWHEEALKHETLDTYFIRPPSNGDPF